MKRMLGISVALMTLSSSGFASTGPADWTGFYVGANAGAGFNNSNYQLQPTGCFLDGTCGGSAAFNPLRSDSGNFTDTHFVGGLLAGYNYTFYDNKMLAGIEADYNYSSANESDYVNRALLAPLGGNFIHTVSQKFDRFGTLRLRFGAPLSCRWLLYLTGGFAYGHIGSSTQAGFTLGGDGYTGASYSDRGGIAAGAGAEYAFADTWSARLEYLYVDLGNYSYTNVGNAAAPVGGTYQTTVATRDNLLRLSLNYKFSAF